MKVKCKDCSKKMKARQAYRCRICNNYYCEQCSLEHFGLKDIDGRVTFKSMFKSILWVVKKNLGFIKEQ